MYGKLHDLEFLEQKSTAHVSIGGQYLLYEIRK